MKQSIFIAVIFLFVLIITTACFSQDFGNSPVRRSLVDNEIMNLDTRALSQFSTYKDPFVSSMLSFMWTGVGQFYNEDYYKGSMLLFADVTEKLLIVGLLIRFRMQYGEDDKSVDWTELTGSDKALILSAGILYAGIWIYSIIDAWNGAVEYNRHFFSQPSLQFGFYTPPKGMGLQLSTRF